MFDKNIASERIIDEFLEIARVPRPSGHEEKMGDYLCNWAKAHNLSCERDGVGNVIIEKSSSEGFENVSTVVLQSHMDMVCVSSGKEIDFNNEGITVFRDGDSLYADNTTLGADDGAGMAIALYILSDNSLKHPKLRAVFTVDEEQSMKGASALDEKYLEGKCLINLDWEEFGSICASCANNVFLSFDKKCDVQKCTSDECVKLTVSNLLGGHSGCDINLGRGNALKIMAELISRIEDEGCKIEGACLKGGTVKNAIASSAQCVIGIKHDDREMIEKIISAFQNDVDSAFPEEKAAISIENAEVGNVFSEKDFDNLVGLLEVIHSGVYYMSRFTKDFVETSRNIGVACAENGRIHLEVLSRSSSQYHSNEMKRSAKALANAFEYELAIPNENPIWEERGSNQLTDILQKAFFETTGENAELMGVHAGLECAYFSSVKPDMMMVSIGPQLYDVHSPKERWDVSRLGDTIEFLLKALEMLGEAK